MLRMPVARRFAASRASSSFEIRALACPVRHSGGTRVVAAVAAVGDVAAAAAVRDGAGAATSGLISTGLHGTIPFLATGLSERGMCKGVLAVTRVELQVL